jgi:methylthioribose-1-phosphate isomerase
MPIESIVWKNDSLFIIDQTLLPQQEIYIKLDTLDKVTDAIVKLRVRGAPAIGIAAAYGAYVVLRQFDHLKFADFKDTARSILEIIAKTRPTAVNLSWAVNQIHELVKNSKDLPTLLSDIFTLAQHIHSDDRERCSGMGRFGAEFIKDGATILTHCNTGALATGGIGTALAAIYTAHAQGKKVHVFADETRPLLQGSRLTAYELQKAGIQTTLIADSMAAMLMRAGHIDLVIVGADRIVANGDIANKIGTYSVAVNARYHNIPFYVSAPLSTFDFDLASGADIVIEQRAADEVRFMRTAQTAPADIPVFNPAFDVTPADLITAIITEKGIIENPDKDKIEKFKRQENL